jgi:tRNA(adenine34) deaminase
MLLWDNIEKPWQECFKLGFESFKKGSIPIGAVVINEKGDIIATGRSLQYEDSGDIGEIYRHKLSHAELNALLKFSEFDHPNIRQYTLYTTTEPCPLCIGALVMSNIRNIKFVARDRFAGSTDICNKSKYIKSKNIKIDGPYSELEKYQIALHTAYELKRNYNSVKLLNAWGIDCPSAVDAGIKLFQSNILETLISKEASIKEVFETCLLY